jgi:membrane protease YdiL (CAAX protease family)
VLAALWIATHFSRTPFAEYLALRWTSWINLAIGVVALIVLVMGWDLLSRATGREVAPGFMGDVLKSAQADGALWLLVIAFCIAAPVSEELFARGFLYRGWSESAVGPVGAIILSSMVWTALHLQYDWFFFGEVFSIGLLLGYLRYRSGSTWLTIVVHGLNNLAATLQTLWLTSHG